jgi:hypothetical protein
VRDIAAIAPQVTARRSSLCGASLLCIPLHPFPAAQNPGYEHVGQALRFCLSDLVIMKDVPARTCTARELGLDLGEQTLNAVVGLDM